MTSGLLPDWRVTCPFPSSPPALSWHDLFPWQPLPPSIHTHTAIFDFKSFTKNCLARGKQGLRKAVCGLVDGGNSGSGGGGVASVPPRAGFLPADQTERSRSSGLCPPRVNKHRGRVRVRANCSARITQVLSRLVVALASPFISDLPPPPPIKGAASTVCRAESLACRRQVAERRRREGTNGLAACVVKGTYALAAAAAHFA